MYRKGSREREGAKVGAGKGSPLKTYKKENTGRVTDLQVKLAAN